MSFEANMADLKRQHALGGGLFPAQIDWAIRALESQDRVIKAARNLINAQEVSLLNKDLELYNFRKQPLTEDL